MLSLSDEGFPGTDSLLLFEQRALTVSNDLIDVDTRLSDPNTPEEERGGLRRRKQALQLKIAQLQEQEIYT